MYLHNHEMNRIRLHNTNTHTKISLFPLGLPAQDAKVRAKV